MFSTHEEWEDSVKEPLQLFTQTIFSILAVLFIVTGIILISKLKSNFQAFYKEFRCIMITASCLLTIPLTFRAIFDGIKLASPRFYDRVNDTYKANAIYNFFFFLLTTYLPIVG